MAILKPHLIILLICILKTIVTTEVIKIRQSVNNEESKSCDYNQMMSVKNFNVGNFKDLIICLQFESDMAQKSKSIF